MMYGSWDIKCKRTKFFVILGHFLPFDPPDNPKNQDFEKIRKTAGDIIILHLCTTNDNHMMYGSWDIKCDRHNFLPLWAIFCPFTPLTTQKKIPGDIILHMGTINTNHMMHDSWDMECNRQNFFSHFGPFFVHLPLPPSQPKELKFWKNEKKP